MHRRGRRGFTSVLICVFLIVSVTPSLLYPKPPFAQSPPFAPPLAMPEDPLGQQTEEQPPDISLDVDVRDGHLTARVVDIWGPGRVPLVMRSYTYGSCCALLSGRRRLTSGHQPTSLEHSDRAALLMAY